MQTKIIFILLFSIVLFSTMLGILFLSSDKQDIRTSTPEETLKHFWNSSLSGNVKNIKQISQLPPEDMLEDCKGEIEQDSSIDSSEPKLSERTNSVEDSIELSSDNKRITSDEMSFRNKNTDSSITNLARYIYTSEISFSRVRIVQRKVFENEAILEIEIADIYGKFNPTSKKMIFLLLDEKSWDVLASVNKGVYPSNWWDNILFATPRQKCG